MYDINKLRALRDTIDTYLEVESQREMMVEGELQAKINEAVDAKLQPLLTEFEAYLKSQAKTD